MTDFFQFLAPDIEDFCRDSGQDYRYHHHRDFEHLAFRSPFRVAEGLMFFPSVSTSSDSSSRVVRRLVTLPLLFALCLFTRESILAQQANDDDVVRVTTNLSLFPIRVRNRNQHVPAIVTSDSFQMKDRDGVTTSLYFAAGAERVAIAFVLDESGSLGHILGQQRDAALALWQRFTQNSRVAVLRFSRLPQLVVPFGNDATATRAAFDFRARKDTPTAIFDAAATAVQLFDVVTRDPAERRIVILISDGLDTASAEKPAAVINAARARNVSFYTIQVPLFEPRDGHLIVRGPSRGFKDLAEKTGGKFFVTADARAALSATANQDLGPVFRAIEDDLRSQYVVGFYLGEKAFDGQEHRVSIMLKDSSAEYSLAQYGFSRKHNFSIRLPRQD